MARTMAMGIFLLSILSFPVTLSLYLQACCSGTHNFTERRIEGEVLLRAHDVVNSLNKDIIHTAPLEEKRTEKLVQLFLSTLPSFATGTNELGVSKQVLFEEIGIDDFRLRELSGGSGAKVFGVFVPDNSGKLVYVIKTMERRAFELARELDSLQALSDLNLRQSHLPTALRAGKFSLQQSKAVYTIFVQTAAKGKSFLSLVKDAGAASSTIRKEKLKSFQKGFTRAAIGMAELHLKNNHRATPIAPNAKKFNIAAMKEVYELLKGDIAPKGRIPLTQTQLDEIHKSVLNAILGNWGKSGYCHGDSHLENLFFDSSSKLFSFIDTPSFLASVDKSGDPIGFPPYDFAWTFYSISYQGYRSGLSPAEVKILQDTFKREYENAMGSFLTPPSARRLAAVTKQFYFIHRAYQNQQYLVDHKTHLPSLNTEGEIERLQQFIDHEVNLMMDMFK